MTATTTTTADIAALPELLALLRDLAAAGAPDPISLGVGTPSRQLNVMLDRRDDAERWATMWPPVGGAWTVSTQRLRADWRGWRVNLNWRAGR